MRTVGILFALMGALALVVACGDDDPKPQVKLDTGVTQDGSGQQDQGVTKLDMGTTQQDTNPPAITNSGVICSGSCTAPGESCMALEQSATKGMCLGKCNAAQADCPVADKATQLSKCLLQDTNKQLHCAWICDSQGKLYDCPNKTDYKCIALNAQQPDVKYCAPN